MLVLLGLLLVFVVAGIAVYRQLRTFGLIPTKAPLAAIHVGQQLPWREIAAWRKGPGVLGASPGEYWIAAGDINGDGVDELAVSHSTALYSDKEPPDILDLGGNSMASLPRLTNSTMSRSPMISSGINFDSYVVTLWPFGAAGRAHAVAVDQLKQAVRIVDMQGHQVGSLDGYLSSFMPLQADVTGDGHPELIVSNPQDMNELYAYDHTGQRVMTATVNRGGNVIAGDVDGDGRAELIGYDGTQMLAYGLDQSPAALPWKGDWPGVCADLNGDGTDEIISASRYLDPVSGTLTRLQFPSPVALNSWGGRLAVGDFTGSGTPEIAVLATLSAMVLDHTAVFLFATDGSLIYYEEFGEPAHCVAVARGLNRDHLVVLLSHRLLIAP